MPMHEIRKGPDGSTWQFRLSLGRDPITQKYRRVSENFEGPSQTGKRPPKEVQAAYAEFETRARAGLVTNKRGATLNDAWAVFLEGASLADYTVLNYKLKWDKHVRPGIGKTPVADLTPMALTLFYKGLVDDKGLSPQTARKIHANVRVACRAAVLMGWITAGTNPALAATTPRTETERHPEVPTIQHVAQLVDLATTENPELGMFFELAAGTGCRRGEVLALRRSNLVEVEGGNLLIEVKQAVCHVGGRVELKGTKSHQERSIHLGPELTKLVRAHLARQTMRAHASMVTMAPDPFLFARDAAGADPWLPEYPTHRFMALWARVEAQGAPHAKLHDLRHFHITELIDAGVPLPAVRDRVGHYNLAMTSRYAGSRKETDQAAAEAFEERRRKAAGE